MLKNEKKVKKMIKIILFWAFIFSIITIFVGISYIATGMNSIESKMTEYHVNKKTIMWLADLGIAFFGNSKIGAILSTIISLIIFILIIVIFIFSKLSDKTKKKLNKPNVVSALSVTSILTFFTTAILLIVGSISLGRLISSSKKVHINEYFEFHSYEISKDKELTSKAALTYTLINKEKIKSYSKTNELQMSLMIALAKTLQEKEVEIKAKFPILYTKLQAITLKGNITGTEKIYTLFNLFNDIAKAKNKEKIAVMFLNAQKNIVKLGSNDFHNIFKLYSKDLGKNFMFIASSTPAGPLYNSLDTEELSKTNWSDILVNVINWNMHFENKELLTLVKLIGLPFQNGGLELEKSKWTVLEWLNTTVNSIDYISKDGKFSSQNNKKSMRLNGGVFSTVINSHPNKIFIPKMNVTTGKFTLDTNEIVGVSGQMMFTIKENMMKTIYKQLPINILNDLKNRQKIILKDTFIHNILKSTGLHTTTNQYVSFNEAYNENGEFRKSIEYKKMNQKIFHKIKSLLNM